MRIHRTLKPGDMVQLNGSGPRMTVIKYITEHAMGSDVHSNLIVRCHWYENDGEKTADYHQDHLVRVSSGERQHDHEEEQAHIRVSHDRLINPNKTTPGNS